MKSRKGREQPMISFLVPALNEELNLPPLFDRLLALEKKLDLPCEILVIDDASDDNTLRVAQDAAAMHPQIRVYNKPKPHGIGRGIRAGLARARGRMGVIIMADGVDPLESAVSEFSKKILDEKCNLVLLSRYIDRGDSKTIPLSYKLYQSVFRFFTKTLLGIPYLDTTYAFRAFDVEFVRQLGLVSDGFEISPELTFKAYFSGAKMDQVSGRQTRRIHGKSKFLFSAVAAGYARVLFEGLMMRMGWTGRIVLANSAKTSSKNVINL